MKQERMYELLQPLFRELQEEYGAPLMKVGVTLDIAWHPFTQYQRARTSHLFKIGSIPDMGIGFEMTKAVAKNDGISKERAIELGIMNGREESK